LLAYITLKMIVMAARKKVNKLKKEQQRQVKRLVIASPLMIHFEWIFLLIF